MLSVTDIKNKIQGLIDSANNKTGLAAEDLTTAVNALIDLPSAEETPAFDWLSITTKTEKPYFNGQLRAGVYRFKDRPTIPFSPFYLEQNLPFKILFEGNWISFEWLLVLSSESPEEEYQSYQPEILYDGAEGQRSVYADFEWNSVSAPVDLKTIYVFEDVAVSETFGLWFNDNIEGVV